MLFPILGRSYAGKSVIMAGLRETVREMRQIQNITTRPERPTDNPAEYRFMTPEEFEKLWQTGELIWRERPHDGEHWYGTRYADIDQALAGGRHLFSITLSKVNQLYAYAVNRGAHAQVRPIFLHITNNAELHRRAAERQDNPEDIVTRIKSGVGELSRAHSLDVISKVIDATQSKAGVLAEVTNYILSQT